MVIKFVFGVSSGLGDLRMMGPGLYGLQLKFTTFFQNAKWKSFVVVLMLLVPT